MSKLSVSVLIIAQNAAYSLRRCLDSLTAFEEVVLVDGGSSDATIEIAKEYPNVKVFQNPWPGFIAQRNFSIEKATHKWCFMMDADEAVSEAVINEISRIIQLPQAKKLYRIVRTEYFEGEAIEYAYGKSDYQERLFQTKHIRYTGGNHHEHLIDGRLAKVGDPEMGEFPKEMRILHWPHYGIDDWIKKLPRFIVLVAEEKLDRGKNASAFVVLATLFGTFFQIYAKSWKQGKVGFVIAVSEACYRTLVKLNMYTKKNVRKDRSKNNFEQQYLN